MSLPGTNKNLSGGAAEENEFTIGSGSGRGDT